MPDNPLTSSSLAPDLTPKELAGWIPVHLETSCAPFPSALHWQYAGQSALDDSFFAHTPERLAREYPEHPTLRTGVDILKAYVHSRNALPPTAFIFHTGRCGSTLLANALRAVEGAISLSEPMPLGDLLLPDRAGLLASSPEGGAAERADLVRGAVAAYGQRRTGAERRYFIKFYDWHVLEMAFLKALWPEVPCVFLYRDPIEVMRSHLSFVPKWLLFRTFPPAYLRLDAEEARRMTLEEYYARILGLFCQAAIENLDARTALLNYTELNLETIVALCRFCGIDESEIDADQMRAALSLYSKDARPSRTFTPDAERKRASASPLMREMARRYAEAPFASLEALRPAYRPDRRLRAAGDSSSQEHKQELVGESRREMQPSGGEPFALRLGEYGEQTLLDFACLVSDGTDAAPAAAQKACQAYRMHCAGLSEEAGSLYAAALESEPRNGTLWFLSGRLQAECGELERARVCLMEAVAVGLAAPELYQDLGEVCLALERYAEAEPILRRWLELDPENPLIWFKLASALSAQGKCLESIFLFSESALSESALPDDLRLEAYLGCGAAMLATAHFEESAAFFRRSIDYRGDIAAFHFGLSRALTALKRTDEAVVAWRRGLELEPDSALAQQELDRLTPMGGGFGGDALVQIRRGAHAKE